MRRSSYLPPLLPHCEILSLQWRPNKKRPRRPSLLAGRAFVTFSVLSFLPALPEWEAGTYCSMTSFAPRPAKRRPRRSLFMKGGGPSWPFVKVRVETTPAGSVLPLLGSFLATRFVPYASASVKSNMLPWSFGPVPLSVIPFSGKGRRGWGAGCGMPANGRGDVSPFRCAGWPASCGPCSLVRRIPEGAQH